MCAAETSSRLAGITSGGLTWLVCIQQPQLQQAGAESLSMTAAIPLARQCSAFLSLFRLYTFDPGTAGVPNADCEMPCLSPLWPFYCRSISVVARVEAQRAPRQRQRSCELGQSRRC